MSNTLTFTLQQTDGEQNTSALYKSQAYSMCNCAELSPKAIQFVNKPDVCHDIYYHSSMKVPECKHERDKNKWNVGVACKQTELENSN